ncbi:hypothetical protein DESACE_05665 [Desulfurella acetivorans A63]|nr:hypothetical protein DESACE_05665 [Desulfurella acetivorans A63]
MSGEKNFYQKPSFVAGLSLGFVLVIIILFVIIINSTDPKKKYEEALTRALQQSNCTLSNETKTYLNQLAKRIHLQQSDKEFITAKVEASLCQPHQKIQAQSKTQNVENATQNQTQSKQTVNEQNQMVADQHINLGVMLASQKNFQKAEQEFSAAISAAPNYSLGYVNLAATYISEGFYEKAINTAKDGITNAGNNADLYYELACAQSQKGDLGNALDSLSRALSLGFSHIDQLSNDPDLNNLRTKQKSNFCNLLAKNHIAIKYCM